MRDFAARGTIRFPSVALPYSGAGADAFRSKKSGAIEFLTKPKTREKLKTALDSVIARTDGPATPIPRCPICGDAADGLPVARLERYFTKLRV